MHCLSVVFTSLSAEPLGAQVDTGALKGIPTAGMRSNGYQQAPASEEVERGVAAEEQSPTICDDEVSLSIWLLLVVGYFC